MERIALIRRSLTAFACGLVGLLPVIGIPFGVSALFFFIKARLKKNAPWNPASDYLDLAAVFALIGLILSLITVGIVAAIVINNLAPSGGSGGGWNFE